MTEQNGIHEWWISCDFNSHEPGTQIRYIVTGYRSFRRLCVSISIGNILQVESVIGWRLMIIQKSSLIVSINFKELDKVCLSARERNRAPFDSERFAIERVPL